MEGVPKLYGWRWPATAALCVAFVSLLAGRAMRLDPLAFSGAYGLAVALLAVAFVIVPGIEPGRQLARRWRVGAVGGALLGLWTARGALAEVGLGDLHWRSVAGVTAYGIWYGAAEALAVSVVPVLSLYGALPAEVLIDPGRRLRHGGIALAASAVIALANSVAFAYDGAGNLVTSVAGNLVFTLGYLLTGSPLTPLLGHAIAHSVWALSGPMLPPPF